MNIKLIEFRVATENDATEIWKILQQAILRRKNEGSLQWQEGYPNEETVKNDIEQKFGHVLTENGKIAAYSAIIFNYEPAYDEIDGNWLSDGEYFVVHRVAVHDEFGGKGYATEIFRRIEDYSKSKNVFSIKVDTNYDNAAMLKILKKLNYIYCGEVYFRGSARMAFEKILK